MAQQQAQIAPPQEDPITLEELTADMSPEEIDALMNDPQKMEQGLRAEGVV